jgi:hypothetical protein
VIGVLHEHLGKLGTLRVRLFFIHT